MNLDETQKKQVAAWIDAGLKLSEIQTRIASELGLKLTYMEVRMLVDDLKLVPKDPEPPKPAELTSKLAAPGSAAPAPAKAAAPAAGELGAGLGSVSVTVDQLTRPGAMVSGKVTFSDGETASWYMDEMGRLGLAPAKQGYRPPAPDVQKFQQALERELTKLGF
jgi:hypothetical protein